MAQREATGLADPAETEGRQDGRVAILVENFARDYPAFQYAFVNFLVDHLTDLSRSYGGDFQQILILAIIGQRRLNVVRGLPGPDRPHPETMAISASRLADVTGIPRETVRRKLALLERKGWVGQGEDGAWSLLADPEGQDLPVRRDHAAFQRRASLRIAQLVAVLETVGVKPAD